VWPNNKAIHVANRGLGMYGNWLFFMATDNYLVSLNAKDGTERWRMQIADVYKDFFSSIAPLIIHNHVIVAPGNNDDIRAYLESRDPETGALQWRWFVDPKPGEPGSETWVDAETMAKGGGFPWLNGTYDPELNLYYFGTGNGVPMQRPPHPTPTGDSLYTASIVALNPDTGKMAWAFQVTPHDTHDYDAAQTPILFDAEFKGEKRKLLAQVSRNGYFFLLDRVTGSQERRQSSRRTGLPIRDWCDKLVAAYLRPKARPHIRERGPYLVLFHNRGLWTLSLSAAIRRQCDRLQNGESRLEP
jgi:alcohol dehydrogenase (cytochrome c)